MYQREQAQASFLVRKYDGSWATTTTSGANGNDITASGMTTFGDYTIGEPYPLAITCPGPQTLYTGSNDCTNSITLTGLASSTSLPATTITYSPSSGANLPLGVTNYTATAIQY